MSLCIQVFGVRRWKLIFILVLFIIKDYVIWYDIDICILIEPVSDKSQVRATGPINQLTRQPLKGRKKHGGIRCGEVR